MKTLSQFLAAIAGVAIAAAGAPNAEDLAKVEPKSTHVSGTVWMVEGAGGNIGVSAGDEGLFIVDAQFAPLFPKLKAAFEKISPKPLRFLFNTHWHTDHTGGNEQMAEAGALIIAQDNVRKRLSTDQVIAAFGNRKVPASPKKAWPVVTLDDEIEVHFNGEDIRALYVPNAHTDGDCIVHFPKADVIHTGDVFINGAFPVIDYSSGGTLDGYLKAQERVLALAGPKTKIIPGHGPLGDKAALQYTHDQIKKFRDRIAPLADQGKSLADVEAAKVTADADPKWLAGMIKPEMFVDMAFNGYLAEKAQKKAH